MNLRRQIDDAISYARRDILASLAREPLELNPSDVWDVRSKLHVLHHYCIKSEIPVDIESQIEVALEISANLWRLISESIDNVGNLKDYTNVRTLSAESSIIQEAEEILSGEDTLRDVIIFGISFLLDWKSNTIWVDSAKKGRKIIVRNYLMELQDQLWQFIKGGSQNGVISLAKARQIGRRADQFLLLISETGLPTEMQVVMLIRLYALLLRLQLDRIITSLDKANPNNEE
ncbi:TPA: hypothetical protein EYP66_15655 [Candidatus Poribacteria bacterium]|nr:hypothetical protein [Candidatus Poribacteria bacterium]